MNAPQRRSQSDGFPLHAANELAIVKMLWRDSAD
jgi:hypothetical protein